MAGVQQFGTMDLVGGLRDVMFCADDDRPTEGLLTWAGDDLLSAGGVAVQITARDGFLSLKPALLYKINSVGGLYAPQWAELSAIQQEMLLARIELKSSATGTAGQWSTELGRPENSILFAPIDPPRTLPSDTCEPPRVSRRLVGLSQAAIVA